MRRWSISRVAGTEAMLLEHLAADLRSQAAGFRSLSQLVADHEKLTARQHFERVAATVAGIAETVDELSRRANEARVSGASNAKDDTRTPSQ